jgi:hypothetical protein
LLLNTDGLLLEDTLQLAADKDEETSEGEELCENR